VITTDLLGDFAVFTNVMVESKGNYYYFQRRFCNFL